MACYTDAYGISMFTSDAKSCQDQMSNIVKVVPVWHVGRTTFCTAAIRSLACKPRIWRSWEGCTHAAGTRRAGEIFLDEPHWGHAFGVFPTACRTRLQILVGAKARCRLS